MFDPVVRQPWALGCGGHTVGAMSRLVLLLLVGAALSAVDVGAAAAAQRWRVPLPQAAVVGGFRFDRAAPYVGGQRRGVDLRGVPGARVVAACAGTVTYAGRVPRWGRGVSLRCGGLIATELGLASSSVVRGARVWPGAVLGRLGSRGVLRLGARRVGSVQGYVDPLALLSRGDRFAPPSVAPRAAPALRPPSGVAPPAVPVAIRHPPRAAVPAAAARPAVAATPRAGAFPWPAWAGLALLATGAGGSGVGRRGRRPRRRTGMALAQR
jgi:hypothetical protein